MTISNIEFEKIPSSMRVPGVYSEYNNKEAVTALPVNPQQVLIVAPMTTASETPFSLPVQAFNDIDVAETFGYGSWCHLMTRQAIRNNPNIRLTVVGVSDHEAGVVATGGFSFSGTAMTTGLLTAVIAGEAYQISVAKGENDVHIASRLMAVINASRYCPAVASVEESNKKQLTITAKSKGEIGNEISLSVKSSVSGLTVSVQAMANGQQNATIAPALASVAGFHFNVIISAFVDEENATALREHLDAVSDPQAKKPAIGVMGWRGSFAQGITFTQKLNAERLTVAWYKGATESNALIAAGYGAVIASEEDPARPLNTLEVKGLSLVDSSQLPTFSEFNQALYNGLTPLEVVNYRVRIMRAITTYTKSVTHTDDPSYLDLTTIRSLDYVRKAIEERIELRFPRSKLNQRVAVKVKSEILDVLYRLEAKEIVENVDLHKARLIVARNPHDVNRLDTQIPADVVNGLHIVANRIDLIL